MDRGIMVDSSPWGRRRVEHGWVTEQACTCQLYFIKINLNIWQIKYAHILLWSCKVKVKVKSLSHVLLFATPWTCSPPGSSVHGIFQAKILGWVAISSDPVLLLLLLLSCFSRVCLCATSETAAYQAPPSLGFSRQEHGVGCHFLLQCMKVKSESEVTQSCLTLCDPMDCSPPGSSIHGICQARVLEWGAIAFSVWSCK